MIIVLLLFLEDFDPLTELRQPMTPKLLSELISRLRGKKPVSMVIPRWGSVYWRGLAS